MSLRKTPLYDRHVALGAKMVPFAGFEMPMKYAGITEEHLAVRMHAGLFDVTHMGEFIIKGKEATDLVQYISSNDVRKLEPGDAQYSCIPNTQGGIIDDMIVYRLFEDRCNADEQAYMLVVNASNRSKDKEWIEKHNKFDAKLEDISDDCGLIALQGPSSKAILAKICSVDLDAIPYYHFTKGTVADCDNILISNTGYTGSGGFELYCRNAQLGTLWDALMREGKDFKLEACGLGARDTLRLEMGYCLYGNELNEDTNPFEAGLSWITKLNKKPFLAEEILRDLKQADMRQRLVGFQLAERRVPRNHYEIQDAHGQSIGSVTSGTHAPSLDLPIGMGYVHVDHAKPGTKIYISTGRKILEGQVCKLPFFKVPEAN